MFRKRILSYKLDSIKSVKIDKIIFAKLKHILEENLFEFHVEGPDTSKGTMSSKGLQNINKIVHRDVFWSSNKYNFAKNTLFCTTCMI